MVHDRKEFIHLLTDYYNFCNRIFWHATVEQAPAGGWPLINQETLANLKRNDKVTDLLRYILYVDHTEDDLNLAPFNLENTLITDYRSEDTQKKIRNGYIEGLTAPRTGQDPAIPPSCAGIAICRGRNGYEIIVDTNDGTIYWGEPGGGHDGPAPELNSILKQVKGNEANEWRLGFNVYESADIFAFCKERYRELSWIVLDSWSMSVMRQSMKWDYESQPDPDSDPDDDFSHIELARKMKQAGWPGDGEGKNWDMSKFERQLSQGNEEEE